MYTDMPNLVEASGGPSPWDSAPLAGTTHWPPPGALGAGSARSWGAPANDAAVIPGGFGAGTPRLRTKQAPARPRGTPAPPGFGTFGHSPSGASVHNPWLSAPIASPPAPDPFQLPAAAFDQQRSHSQGGTPYPMQGGGLGGYGDPPPQAGAGFGATPSWYNTPRTHAGGFEFEDEGGSPEEGEYAYPPPPAPALGWGGSQAGDPWAFGGGKIASTPSMGAGYASGPRSQYKRPEEWRSDFTMGKPAGGLTRFFSRGKGAKEGGEYAVHLLFYSL